MAQEQDKNKRYILVLNKIDRIKREALLDISLKLNEACNFEATFMISALKGSGVKDVVKYLAKNMPEGPWHFPEDQLTDMPMRLMAAEMTREKLFKLLHQEIPYALTVETDNWENFDNGDIKIDQTIYIAREAHKKIEKESADKIFSLLPDKIGSKLHQWWLEFEENKTPEAKFANNCDYLQGFSQSYFARGKSWKELGITREKTVEYLSLIHI